MATFKVIDADGDWVANPCQFGFVDPETRVRYDPGMVLKVSLRDGSWLAGQIEAGVLSLSTDPSADPPKPASGPPAAKPKAAPKPTPAAAG